MSLWPFHFKPIANSLFHASPRPRPVEGRSATDLPPPGPLFGPVLTGAPSPDWGSLWGVTGLPPAVRTSQAISRRGGESKPVDQARPLHTVQEERAIDPNNPNMGSCAGPYETVRRYTRSEFITHGDPITDATPIP